MNLAVGFFDGVHLGHRRILAQADAALTFRNHPATVYAPDRVPALLMTCATRLSAMSAALRPSAHENENPVRALTFTKDFADRTPEDFADWLHTTYPGQTTIFCGENWTFGAGGRGTPDFLRMCGFQVEVIPYAKQDGLPVSSTRVRTAVTAGDLTTAAEMLGEPWRLEGEVVAGKGLARKLGFPTINIRPEPGLVRPPCGVYAVETSFGPGIANYGHAPTLRNRAWDSPVLEVHVFAQDVQVVPGERITVKMRRFIRPERSFATVDELKAQIVRDIAANSGD